MNQRRAETKVLERALNKRLFKLIKGFFKIYKEQEPRDILSNIKVGNPISDDIVFVFHLAGCGLKSPSSDSGLT